MKTIEIEKKVRLEPHHLEKIIQKGDLVNEIHIQDSYFDTADYLYTAQNVWLRQRNGMFELKVGMQKQYDSIDRYEEITDENSILNNLGIDLFVDFPSTLAQNKLFSFCNFATKRKSYKVGEFNIDIDEADFGDLRYNVAEIEIIVSNSNLVHEAEQKIDQLIKEMGIDTSIPTTGKLSYYIYCKRPEHYQALVQNKVIRPITLDCIF